jgi:hypothetical protein
MPGLDANVDGRFAYRHKTMAMDNKKRKARVFGVQLVNDLPHHSLGHRFIDFVQQAADCCSILGASHNAAELYDRARLGARFDIRDIDRPIGKADRYLHKRKEIAVRAHPEANIRRKFIASDNLTMFLPLADHSSS